MKSRIDKKSSPQNINCEDDLKYNTLYQTTCKFHLATHDLSSLHDVSARDKNEEHASVFIRVNKEYVLYLYPSNAVYDDVDYIVNGPFKIIPFDGELTLSND